MRLANFARVRNLFKGTLAVLNTVPAQFCDTLQAGGNGFRSAQGLHLRVTHLAAGNLGKTTVMDAHLQVVDVSTAVQDTLADDRRHGLNAGAQIGDLRTDFRI